MTKAVTLIVFFASLFCPAHAQQTFSVSGVVRDRTGAAVAGAEVRFHSSKFDSSTRTAQDGSFEMAVPEPSGAVSVSAAGFAAAEQAWTASTRELSFVLQPASIEQQIVVSATRTEMKLSDVPGSAVLLFNA